MWRETFKVPEHQRVEAEKANIGNAEKSLYPCHAKKDEGGVTDKSAAKGQADHRPGTGQRLVGTSRAATP